MIENTRQYKITQEWVSDFEKELARLEARGAGDVHPVLYKAQMDAIRSEIRELKQQLDLYDALRQGRLRVLELDSFAELPRGLIQARIAAGLTQRDLAERLGLREQQIQHYESTDYASASIRRVQEVIRALGVEVSEEIRLAAVGTTKALSLAAQRMRFAPTPALAMAIGIDAVRDSPSPKPSPAGRGLFTARLACGTISRTELLAVGACGTRPG